jgi:hypothetical protein
VAWSAGSLTPRSDGGALHDCCTHAPDLPLLHATVATTIASISSTQDRKTPNRFFFWYKPFIGPIDAARQELSNGPLFDLWR